MFDGSHRTNKREINLAGASASSKSSRQNNLAVARRERQARAAAKARLDSSVRIQRYWRGRRARRDVAIEFGCRYSEIISILMTKNDDDVMSDYDDEQGRKRLERLANATTLLAFRMTPALLPYYSSRHNNTEQEDVDEHSVAKTNLCQDLLLLENVMRILQENDDPDNRRIISPIAARRIASIILILLRQSINSSSSLSPFGTQQLRQDNDEHLVQLLDRLLASYIETLGIGQGCYVDSSLIFTNRTSDYYMSCLPGERSNTALVVPTSSLITSWMIHLFICFRDVVVVATSIDDAVRRGMSSVLLKWCCRIIVQLNETIGKQQDQELAMDEVCLAILGTIFYSSSCNFEDSWMDEYLIPCLAKLEHRFMGRLPSRDDKDPCSLMIHYISMAMNHISMNLISITAIRTSIEQFECRNVPGFLPTYSAQFSSDSSIKLLHVVRDTLYLREHIVLNKVIQYTNECQHESHQTILIHAIPIILLYTLQHQHDFAILSMFAAQGENVSSWIVESMAKAAASVANFPAAEVYIDSDENSEDDEQPTQQQPQRPASRENSSATTARYLRADLQTLPKLDVLYQSISLKAKKATIDRLRSMPALHVDFLVALADKIGKGQWIQELGDSLFSVIQSQEASSSWSNWQCEARIAYTSALSTIMTSCSGIKAGHNAASPLLAKLAFNESCLLGLWQRSIKNLSLIKSDQPSVDPSMIAAACQAITIFCDAFSHQLLAVNDDDFLKRHHYSVDDDQPMNSIPARLVVHVLRVVLNDLYWIRPVLASDITNAQTDPNSTLRFQRVRLLLSGTKLWNSLYERWCRLYRVVQFCEENCWWFPHLLSRGQHENNPIIQSQVTSGGQASDGMDESSVGSASMDDGVDEPASISANDAGGDELANTFRDPKMARVLTYIPQAMPFSRRVNLFNSLLEADKVRTQDETVALRQMMMNFEDGQVVDNGRERVTIRRDLLYSDSKQLLNDLGERLRKRVQVTFVNKHGQQEAGIDGGGVFKEFLDDLISDAFLPELVRGGKSAEGDDSDDDSVVEIHPDFFTVTPLQTLTVNTALDGNDSLSHYEFLGRVLGKSIYGEPISSFHSKTRVLCLMSPMPLSESESILVEPQFCLPFLNQLLGKQNSLDDLKNLDPEFYKNLISLKQLSAQETRDLGLSFELNDSTATTTTIELIPGGSSVPVTKENVIQYIHLTAHQKMNVRGSRQTMAFLHGFRDIIPSQWVRLFSAYELQKLISGDDAIKGIDVSGMMSVMRYSGGFHPSQPIIQWLWEVVGEMTPDHQRKFLKFMSSCSRQPLLGFASMVPAPCIQQTRLCEDNHGRDMPEEFGVGNIRLPTSSTCMNLLKLPKYTSKEMLREKLLYAIESAAGFELS